METGTLHLLLQIAVSAAAALFGARLAAKGFREDHWWERKMETYADLIEELHRMKWPASEHFEAAIVKRDIPDDESEALWREFKEARRRVWMLAERSSFIISYKVMDAVRQMEMDLSNADSEKTWEGRLDEHYGAVEECLRKVKSIGAEELGFFKGKNLIFPESVS